MLPLCGMQQEVCAKPVGFHHFQTTQAAPISVQNMHAFSSLTANNVWGGGGQKSSAVVQLYFSEFV